MGTGETGRDEETATNLLKKQQAIEAEVDSYEYSIKALRSLAQSLVEADHFDKANIEKRRVRFFFFGVATHCHLGGCVSTHPAAMARGSLARALSLGRDRRRVVPPA